LIGKTEAAISLIEFRWPFT